MARITDRKPFLEGQRFFFRSIGALGLSPGEAEAGGHTLQNDGGVSFCGTRVTLTSAGDDRASRLFDGLLFDRHMKHIFRRFACPAAMTST